MLSRRFAAKSAALLAVAALVGCQSTPATAPPPAVAEVNYEGLATVSSAAFDVAQVRPGTDFQAYTRLQLAAPELAYRTPDRAASEFPLSEAQKERFRDALVAAFDQEFAGFTALEIVDETGPATLTLSVRVEDIVAAVDRNAVGSVGRASALLEASGDAVIIVEVSDSQSNEILARGVHAGSVTGGALRASQDEMRSRFQSADKLVRQWAAKTRTGLENLLVGRR
jgi:hypothetical protein